uniref:Uncharacterized protein n=1 Tax=Manihot esculenta TaxID=3983 RepID=A0A2C9WKH3_MANES
MIRLSSVLSAQASEAYVLLSSCSCVQRERERERENQDVDASCLYVYQRLFRL